MKLTIDTQLDEFEVEDKTGRVIGKIYFNPLDTGIVRRYEEVQKAFSNMKNMDTDGMEAVDIIIKAEDKMKEQIDYLLGSDCSSVLFKVLQPMAVLQDGDFYVTKVLDAIGESIKNAQKEKYDRLSKKVSKYTKSYE